MMVSTEPALTSCYVNGANHLCQRQNS